MEQKLKQLNDLIKRIITATLPVSDPDLAGLQEAGIKAVFLSQNKHDFAELADVLNKILEYCVILIKKPGLIAPINFLYLKSHYFKLKLQIESEIIKEKSEILKKSEKQELLKTSDLTSKEAIKAINANISFDLATELEEPLDINTEEFQEKESDYQLLNQNQDNTEDLNNETSNNSDFETVPLYVKNRQKAIFDLFVKNPDKNLQLKDIKHLFPELSERTLRLDLKTLADNGKIRQDGFGRGSKYHFVEN